MISRKKQIESLGVGEYIIITGEPGQQASKLMASIASIFRDGKNMKNQGFTQESGIGIFDGELSRPLIKITRFKDPEI